MKTRSPVPKNENERLKALYEFEILDTLPELRYDDLTRLAASICGCPISIITFVDQDRQWFKATHGLTAKQTPREGGFCAHAIMESEFFVVPNAQTDARFQDHPFVTDQPNIRFYAAAPVSVAGDLNIGVICVIDDKPRQLEPHQIEALKSLSRTVGIFLQGKKLYAELAEAVRQRKESESLLIHSAKMTALGEMAGGIAHEINNPLAIIQLSSEQIVDVTSKNQLDQADVQIVLKASKIIVPAVQRIASIIKSLRTFARDGTKDKFTAKSLNQIIKETMMLCSWRIEKQTIELRLVIPENIQIECREVEISQVILNLLLNSCDAIKELKQKWVELCVVEDGDFIEISITDSGSGIAPEIRKKILQPFFTTKEVGSGTGLGLSIAHGILNSHSGTLRLDDSCANTRFVIRLPKKQNTHAFAA